MSSSRRCISQKANPAKHSLYRRRGDRVFREVSGAKTGTRLLITFPTAQNGGRIRTNAA